MSPPPRAIITVHLRASARAIWIICDFGRTKGCAFSPFSTFFARLSRFISVRVRAFCLFPPPPVYFSSRIYIYTAGFRRALAFFYAFFSYLSLSRFPSRFPPPPPPPCGIIFSLLLQLIVYFFSWTMVLRKKAWVYYIDFKFLCRDVDGCTHLICTEKKI